MFTARVKRLLVKIVSQIKCKCKCFNTTTTTTTNDDHHIVNNVYNLTPRTSPVLKPRRLLEIKKSKSWPSFFL